MMSVKIYGEQRQTPEAVFEVHFGTKVTSVRKRCRLLARRECDRNRGWRSARVPLKLRQDGCIVARSSSRLHQSWSRCEADMVLLRAGVVGMLLFCAPR